MTQEDPGYGGKMFRRPDENFADRSENNVIISQQGSFL
jgi:hypothetical protein